MPLVYFEYLGIKCRMLGEYLERLPSGQECTEANSGCKLATSKEEAGKERRSPLDLALPQLTVWSPATCDSV